MPINTICEKLGKALCQRLPACHALTGCDTTSSFFKIGKKASFTKLQKHLEELKGLRHFGLTTNLRESLPVARHHALILYGQKKNEKGDLCTSLDELRYVLASTSDMPDSQLPPTENSFRHHAAVWCHSHHKKTVLWSPVGKGWRLTEGLTEPVVYEKAAAPEDVRDLTHLYCKDKQCSQQKKCPCFAAGLSCIEFCACDFLECPNRIVDDGIVAP